MKPPVWLNILVASLIAVMVLAAYHSHFDNAFHFDDSHTIESNIYIRDIGNIPSYFTNAETFSSLTTNQSYRPIVTTTIAIDYWAGQKFFGDGLNPVPYHITNFGWFLLQVVLMVFLFKKLLDKTVLHAWNWLIAILFAGWYAVHTVNAETVNYVISRSDILSTVGVVAAMLIFVSNGWGRKYFLYLIPLLLGMLAKPSAIMFMPILAVYLYIFEWNLSIRELPKAFTTRYVNGWLHIMVAAIIGLLGYLGMGQMEPNWIPGGTSRFDYLITQPYVIWHYFKMFFLPTDLTADTDLKAFTTIADPRVFAGVLFVAVLLIIGFVATNYRSLRPVAFGIFWFFFALIPTSSIIPLSEVMNDHRMYFPFVGLVLAVGWPIALWVMRASGINSTEPNKAKPKQVNTTIPAAAVAMCLVVFSGFAYGAYQRSEVWHSEESLWHDVTIKSPENGRGWMNYGLVFMGRGEYDKALECYQTALKYTPNYAYLHVNLAIVYEQQGKQDLALQHFKIAKQVGDFFPEVHYHYGTYLQRHGNFPEAKFELKRTIELSPAHANARYALMQLHLDRQETQELRKLAEETLELLPNDPRTLTYLNAQQSDEQLVATAKLQAETTPDENTYLNLSLVYYNVGKYQDCINAAYKALEYKPAFPEAYNNICSAHNQLQQWDLAIAACGKALEFAPNYELAKNNLNWAKSQKK